MAKMSSRKIVFSIQQFKELVDKPALLHSVYDIILNDSDVTTAEAIAAGRYASRIQLELDVSPRTLEIYAQEGPVLNPVVDKAKRTNTTCLISAN